MSTRLRQRRLQGFNNVAAGFMPAINAPVKGAPTLKAEEIYCTIRFLVGESSDCTDSALTPTLSRFRARGMPLIPSSRRAYRGAAHVYRASAAASSTVQPKYQILMRYFSLPPPCEGGGFFLSDCL